MIEECWKNHPAGIIFKKMSPFKIPYDRVIVRLREAGVLDRVMTSYSSARASTKVSTENSVLKVEHYEGPIYLFVILNFLNTMAFFFEILSIKWSKHRRSKSLI